MKPGNERKRRVMILRNSIDNSNKIGKYASQEKLIAECGRAWGSERRKILEYFNELKMNGAIIIEGDEVWLMRYSHKDIAEFEKQSEITELKDYIGGEDGTTTSTGET